jgi:short-subunit dehydrogenase
MKKAVVVGASSGIGRELVRVLSQEGYEVGLVARRVELLEELQKELPSPSIVRRIDVAGREGAIAALEELLAEMGDVELVVLNSGVGFQNWKLKWEPEIATIDVNVAGFAAMANAAYRYFAVKGKGHLVGISSVAAVRGQGGVPAYNASKAFVSSYLEGLRLQAAKSRTKLDLAVTDIRPGFVDTPMTRGQKGMFWVASAPVVARQILAAIRKRKKVAYVPRRWGLVACLIRVLPEALWRRMH